MDKKAATAAAAPAAVSRAEVVRLWEALLDEQDDTEVAQALFMDALLRDARADHARKAKVNKEQAEDEEDRFAHVFEPWQLPARGSVPMPPPPPPEQKPKLQQPVVAAPVQQVARTLVLGLRAPVHLARNRKHDRTPPGTAPSAGERHPPKSKKPRVL